MERQEAIQKIRELEYKVDEIEDTKERLGKEADVLQLAIDKLYEMVRETAGCDCEALGIVCRGHTG